MKKYKKYIFSTIFIILIGLIILEVKSCVFKIGYDWGRDQEFSSPSGQITIVLRYDYVSRPFLFYKGKMVFAYDKSGFNETSFFDVEWIAEKEIRLYCEQFNEEYFISLA